MLTGRLRTEMAGTGPALHQAHRDVQHQPHKVRPEVVFRPGAEKEHLGLE